MFTIQHRVSQRFQASLPCLLTLVVLVIGAGALASCSTTEGFGNDVKHLGGSIEDSAAKNK